MGAKFSNDHTIDVDARNNDVGNNEIEESIIEEDI